MANRPQPDTAAAERSAPGLTLDDIRADVAKLAGTAVEDIGDGDDLVAVGLDSLDVMKLVTRWQARGVDVGFADLIERRTLGEWWRLVSSRAPAPSAGPPSAEVDEGAPFALAPMQHAYWLGRRDDQVLGVGCHYYFEFDGHGVEAERLDSAVRVVLERHGMLRARFLDDGRQQILEESPWSGLEVHDLRAVDGEAAAGALEAIRQAESHRRLDVEGGRGFDVQLSLLPGGATRVHVNIDMLVADATSFRILIDELAQFYADPGTTRPPLRYSYSRYLREREQRRRGERERARAYWQERLADLPGPPQLPLAVDPARLTTQRTVRRAHRLEPADYAALAARAREHGVTVPMSLAAAFAEVMGGWSAEPRFVLNVPLFDRDNLHPDVAGLVGDFTSSVLLAVDLAEEAPFAGRARQIQTRLRADAANGAYPGVDVLRDLARARPDEGWSRAAVVFTSAVGMGDLFGPNAPRQFGRLAWIISQTAQVWLDHQATELDGGLLVNWDAVEPLFPDGVLDAMFDAYVGIVRRLLGPGSDWNEPVGDLLPAAQRRVRERVNASERPASGRRLHQGFFENAAEEPDRLALAWGDDGRLSYGELADRARRVAALLAARGVAPGDRVAVTIAKGPRQIEAVLGILCAGAAYVPAGVEQPVRRRAQVYGTAGARLVLTTGEERAAIDWPDTVEVVTLEESDGVEPLAAPVAVPETALAYVIFTSGSTGAPKGVMVPHSAAMNTIDDILLRYAITAEDRVLSVSALDFDWTVADIFELLSAGGAVVTIDRAAWRDAWRWADLVRRWKVTLWQSVPALLDMLLLVADREDLASLRLVMLGGDWAGLDQYDRLRALAPECRLAVLGGITETSIHCTHFEVEGIEPHWRSVPYGEPLSNVKCRVVDALGRDCPDWVAGELWVGGAGVALGYAGDPEQTAEKFVDDGCGRWYRSGDLARYWPDGTLEFLGRADAQVKIRGHRIELGEIEAALEAHPQVAKAVAATLEAGGVQIVAAVVPTPGVADPAAVDLDAVRASARRRLPGYMVPERMMAVESLPLGATDKVDRKAVARLLFEHAAGAADADEPPREGIERTVAEVWSELLGVDGIGRRQSFFFLGGDSVLATQVIARLRAAGLGQADLRHLFAEPRLADFAALLEAGSASAPPPSGRLAALQPDPAARYEPFPPTEVQRAYWLGRRAGFTLGGVGSQWYWEFDGHDVDVSRLEEAWNRVVARHDMLRTVFDADGWQQAMAAAPRVPIPVTTAEGDPAAALADLRESLSRRVADPSEWPLFEIRAVRYAGDRTRIGFSFDYIVLDALSIMVVFEELAALYQDPEAPLAPVGLTFRDYLQGRAPDPERVASARRFWAGRLDDLPPAPELPWRKDPARVSEPRFTRREVRLGAARWRTLTGRARQHGLTPATVLATAFAEVLAAWSGRDEMTLVYTLFDREDVHPDIRRVVGDFTSLLLVPHRPPAAGGWLGAAGALQQAVSASLEHRAVSAVEVLRDLGRRWGTPVESIPVVFTSTLGVADELVNLSFPFGDYVGGLSQTPQVALDNQVVVHGGELLINWDAVEEVFPEGLLDAMLGGYLRLLDWLSAPGSNWHDPVPDLRPSAERRTRARVNATAGPARTGTLHHPFFARAAEAPERTALIATDGPLTYGALAERALRVAAFVRHRGAGAGDLVAVTLPKGADQVAAVLGVLAAGAAYLPIGPDQPPARRQRIRDGSGASLVLDDLAAALEQPPLDAPADPAPDALAYVIYTSGSAGEPKGVEIVHRAAVNTVDDVNERCGVGAADRVLAVSALDFDLSVYDLFGPLSAGGTFVLVEEEERREARRWAELVRRHRVTLWNSVPALLDMLLTAAGDDGLGTSLRYALVSGDWVGLDLFARLAAAAPDCRLLALGGATEAAIWSNAFEVTSVPDHWRSIPYGFPLRNQQFRVVDPRGRDCPDWVPGELWIGGAGVARGYRNRPQETAARFVTHACARWYRTGDRGRYWPDGTLEFLGRLDNQVKLRGHRIELGEVEAALTEHPEVARAVAFTVGGGRPALAAAVVPADGAAWDADAMRAFLAEQLPAAMVPERLFAVPSLPLTPQGKIDRHALARLAAAEALPDEGDEPPVGELEETLAAAWADLLEAPRIGRHQSFFSLGGDSLLATVLVENVRRRFGVVLSLRELLANASVARLAGVLAARLGDEDVDGVEEGAL